jgi:2-(1,2-epoxy-1,2-dihydrophenyl)acetyl-CoA isomerase
MKMESPTTLLFKVSDHVAYITLNRPAAANAVSLELAQELEEVARECDESSSVRAVLLTGAGRIFCGGGDLKSFAAQEPTHLPTHLKRVNLFFHSAIQCFARMHPPLVVAVNGNAAGGGMSLACAGDIVLANESARFTIAYTRVGLTPDAASTYYLPRIIGLRRMMELALTNRTLTAREPKRLV